MHANIGTEMFIGQFLIHWMHMHAYWRFRNYVGDNAVSKLCVRVCENACFGWMTWFNAWVSKTVLPLYSKTCLQWTPQYPRERVPTWQMSLRHRFFNMGKMSLITGRPLIAVSLEDRFYCAIKCIGHSIHTNSGLQETRIPQRLKFQCYFWLVPPPHALSPTKSQK